MIYGILLLNTYTFSIFDKFLCDLLFFISLDLVYLGLYMQNGFVVHKTYLVFAYYPIL